MDGSAQSTQKLGATIPLLLTTTDSLAGPHLGQDTSPSMDTHTHMQTPHKKAWNQTWNLDC